MDGVWNLRYGDTRVCLYHAREGSWVLHRAQRGYIPRRGRTDYGTWHPMPCSARLGLALFLYGRRTGQIPPATAR
jgi:hypothetical protein